MTRLHVVSAATRPTSSGRPLAQWVTAQARDHGGFEVTPVDLAEIALPFLDEPEYASTGNYAHQHTRDWSALVDSADAFLFVLPMYNGGFTAPFKNAIDFLYEEWKGKPVGIVSYSAGPTGGAPAAEMLLPILTRLGMLPAEHSVAVPGIPKLIGAEGFEAPEALSGELAAVLADVAALAAGREAELTAEAVTA
ncbi:MULTISPECIES: NADPH-dependent FMN reductase [unclassified Streptomyces]|uniref:NADPH-dependent FMN reductase n=1 Tax=unclassified Streptomyces TaxID=2593676 RepID=UPI00044F50F2|nr:NAD(P)H-dependent oxidoreductase [Streptomyces sp. PCS3-D2]WKV73806.1 NAD(P)H-dependent oxidoreductase [Streptomyces sp. PCS3-D2]